VLRAFHEIQDRLESPADCLLRRGAIELFRAAGVCLGERWVAISTEVWSGYQAVLFAIMAGLGNWQAHWIDVRPTRSRSRGEWALRVKPEAYSWRQLGGAGALAGIGFTMSLFIAGQAFSTPAYFAVTRSWGSPQPCALGRSQ
jgi:Na+:H+ antiporter, NhaA family